MKGDLRLVVEVAGLVPAFAVLEKQIKTALAERVKSEEQTERRDYNALRSICGAAPVTKQSGGTRYVVMRRVCQPRLRVALHISALQAIRMDPKLHDLYIRARARGQTVGRAIRNIADRLLFLAVWLLKRNQLYDIGLRQIVPEVAAATPGVVSLIEGSACGKPGP